MPYQAPGSDITVIVIILIVAILVFGSMLITAFAIFRSQGSPKTEALPREEHESSSVAAEYDRQSPQDKLKDELPLSSLVEIFNRGLLNEGLKKALTAKRKGMGLWSLPITMWLMMGLILVPLLFYTRVWEQLYWVIIVVMIGIVGGGALGVRLAGLSWRETVVAALLTGAGLMLLSRFEFSPFYPGPWDNPERVFNLGAFLVLSALFSIPVFFLPLFDPAVRQMGPAPSSWSVALTALLITLMLTLTGILTSGLSALLLGGTVSAFLLGMGLIMSLVKPTDVAGASLGGIGILLLIMSILNWMMLGGGWFP